MQFRRRLNLFQIVAVERDVEGAERNGSAFDDFNVCGNALCKRNPAALDADQADIAGAVVALDNLVGHPHQRPANFITGHQIGFSSHFAPRFLKKRIKKAPTLVGTD